LVLAVLLVVGTVPSAAGPVPGDRLASFSLPKQSGGVFEWRPGRVTVMSFCAFWCSTWKEQSRRLAEAGKALGGLPVDFVTISIDGRWSEVGAGKISGTVLLDPGRSLSGPLAIEKIPYTVVVDTDGRVHYAAHGITRSQVIEQMVRECVVGDAPDITGPIYLTFDDFPSKDKELDYRLLDVLRKEDVHATFFCICSRVEESGDIVRRAAREGHTLQSHSWDHQAANPKLDRCAKAIKDTVGVEPTLYRPPGSSQCLRIGGKEMSNPVVNPYDFARPGTGEITRRVLLAVKPGGVVLLHAGVSETIDSLPGIIKSLMGRGFSLETLK
jgi:peptidoglycan/xylan/chitin deacetylase (PgdA/CDA1 family)